MRPTPEEASSLAAGPASAKLDRLRFSIEADLWRADPELIAERMLDDAS